MTMFLDRKSLLAKEALTIEKVDLGKDEFVYVRQMSGRERDNWEQSLLKETKDNKGNVIGFDRSMEDFRAKLAVNTLCDEQGNLLLDPSDCETLSKNMSASRLDKIVLVAQKLNKVDDIEQGNLLKNSEGDQVASSSSDSVEN